MFAFVFIDWENIEKAVKQEFGSVLDFEKFVQVIRTIASSNGSRLVGIQAYGDFDRGTAGLMSKLVNLGIDPHHIVTKSAQEYLKGSTDIELSLDILETMYSYPHITDFIFVSGDSDLRYVARRLQKQGKTLRLVGFKSNTSKFLIDMVNEFIHLEQYPYIMRKVTQSEKENQSLLLISDKNTANIIKHLDNLEKTGTKDFIGLNYFRKRLLDYNQSTPTQISDALTSCIECEIIKVYQVPNPNDTDHPTRACKINRNNPAVKYILDMK